MLHEYKLGHSAEEATSNINRSMGLGSVTEFTVRKWFRRFAAGDESLRDERDNKQTSQTAAKKLTTARKAEIKKELVEAKLEVDSGHKPPPRKCRRISDEYRATEDDTGSDGYELF